jgi:hypothetical protein
MSVGPALLLSLHIVCPVPFLESSNDYSLCTTPVGSQISAHQQFYVERIPFNAVLNREYGVIFGYIIRAYFLFQRFSRCLAFKRERIPAEVRLETLSLCVLRRYISTEQE